MNTRCLPKINVTVAIGKGLLEAGAERLGMSFDGCFEQPPSPKAAVPLPLPPQPLPSSVLGQAFGSTREISQCRKQTDRRTIP